MKTSNYNHFIKDNDRILLFNFLTSACISISKNESTIFNEILLNPKQNLNIYPSLTNMLYKLGYIVDNKTEELDLIRKNNNKEIFDNKDLHVTINPTLECNFDCWYCSVKESVQDKSKLKGKISNSTSERIIKYFTNVLKEDKYSSLLIDWFGGEPLLYFNEIIKPINIKIKNLIKDSNFVFNQMITTNGFLITEEMVEGFKQLKINTFQITLDGNKKRHNKIRNNKGIESFDKIIHNVCMILNLHKDALIYLRINYDNKTLNDIESIFDNFSDIDKTRIKIDFQSVWQVEPTTNTIDKLKNLIEKLRLKDFEVILPKYNPNKFYTCYADRKSYVVINNDGNVYKCTARDYSKEHEIGKLDLQGHITYNDKEKDYYKNSIFEREDCIKCELLPICMGGCIQNRYEESIEGKDTFSKYCIKHNQRIDVESYIKMIYEDKTKI